MNREEKIEKFKKIQENYARAADIINENNILALEIDNSGSERINTLIQSHNRLIFDLRMAEEVMRVFNQAFLVLELKDET